MKRSGRTPAEERARAKAQAKRKALKVIRRVETATRREGVSLSDWEGDFLGSLSERISTFGRAFADLEKGAAGAALSVLQMRKLREIAARAEAGRAPPPEDGALGDPGAAPDQPEKPRDPGSGHRRSGFPKPPGSRAGGRRR